MPLQRLTILAGANSAGKSSLIQSLLLLAQSYQESRPVLNGQMTSLGEARDVIRKDQDAVEVALSASVLRYLAEGPRDQVDCTIRLQLWDDSGDLRLQALEVEVDSTVLLICETDRRSARDLCGFLRSQSRDADLSGEGEDGLLRASFPQSSHRVATTLVELSGLFPQAIHQRLHHNTRKRQIASLLEKSARNRPAARELDLALRRVLVANPTSPVPESVAGFIDSRRPEPLVLTRELDDLAHGEMFTYLYKNRYMEWDSLPIGRRAGYRTYIGSDVDSAISMPDEHVTESLHYLSQMSSELAELASSIVYLGPLRDEPRVVYALGRGSRQLPVGAHGEFMADFFARSEHRLVEFHTSEGRSMVQPLRDAVASWLAYLGIGARLEVEEQGKLGRTVRLVLDGVERDLTTIGVGASQLLPVVVSVLGAPRGSVLLFEQPELHLHPAVQSRLGDFLAIARPDLRFVVETHSESLVTRLRLRVVQERVDHRNVSILFGEQVGGVTTFRSLKLNSFGDLSEWPKGFFDEGESDSVRIVHALADRMVGSDGE